MSKRQFKSQASSSRATHGTSFGGFGSAPTASSLSYLSEGPNLVPISDPNVVVAFKNLSKKDATTKSKALEDFRTYVQEHPYESTSGPEDAVLDAWAKVFPRLAIENSRRVRELAHVIQIELLKASRKRIEKHLPKLVGSWLAGTYDRDRGVARSVNDGLLSFLNTDTKVTAFWTKYQTQILEYAQSTFKETPQTLSDERTVSNDDMQEKYFRVVNSSVSLVINLLNKLNQSDLDKHQTEYAEFLSENKVLWTLASCKDTSTRKSVHQLLFVTLLKQSSILDDGFLKLISQTIISEALVAPQSSSAFQLVQALSALTKSYPSVWTSAYKSKKPAFTRLQRFIEKGSQGGPPEYWPAFKALWINLPESVTNVDGETIISFLASMRNGISSREEHRGNLSSAWSTYFDICGFAALKLASPESKTTLLEQTILPAFEQYLANTVGSPKWSVNNIQNLVKAYTVCESVARTDPAVQVQLSDKWDHLSENFVTQLQTSLPEQSKDFQKSQTSVMTQGNRWFDLLGRIVNEPDVADSTAIAQSTRCVVAAAIKVMVSRNGKPFSAAATLEGMLRLAPNYVSRSDILKIVEEVLQTDLENLILSPSSKYLISALFQFRKYPGKEKTFEDLWSKIIHHLLSVKTEEAQVQAITLLLANDEVTKLAQENTDLQQYFSDSFTQALQGNSSLWSLVESITRLRQVSTSVSHNVLINAVGNLDIDSPYLQGAFKTLDVLSQQPGIFKEQDVHVAVVTKLLALTELSDSTVAPRATTIRALISKSDVNTENPENATSSTIHVIRHNLEVTNNQSLSVDTLLQQARSVIDDVSLAEQDLTTLFPDPTRWNNELQFVLESTPDNTLAVMRPFAGAVYLVEGSAELSTNPLTFDTNGYSGPLRSALYTSSLLSAKVYKALSRAKQADMFRLLLLTFEVVNDQLDLLQQTKLFQARPDLDVSNDIRESVIDFQTALASLASDSRSWRRNPEDAVIDTQDSSALAHEIILGLIRACEGTSPSAYYSAKALSRLLSKLVDAHGWQNDGADEWLANIDVLKSSTLNHLAAVGLLTGISEDLDSSKIVNTLCNRLISDVAGASAASKKTLPLVVLLNSTIGVYDDGEIPVAQNRLVFAVKQILSWTDDLPSSNPGLASEACRALQKLLPSIKGMYGSHWSDTLQFCLTIFTSSDGQRLLDVNIPMIGMALKLYSTLKNLDDTNDDLVDTIAEYDEKISRRLIDLLQLRRTTDSQPLAFLDSALSRLVRDMEVTSAEELSGLYPVVASDFKEVQSSAYQLLSKSLPKVQQEISVNVLLERTDARLPEELLSLLLDPPVFSQSSYDDLPEFPVNVRGYLLSWHLIFSAFSTASFKVRNDYIENLKIENYIIPLLDFMFHTLGHSIGKPLNIDQARFTEDEIKSYALSDAPPERELQWLLLNIYYQALEYTPNLVKSWWLACKSKTTRSAVENWTQKYFTTFVIQGVLDEVTQWADNQEPATETEKQLEVRVLRKAREIHASYEVDDTEAEIAIKFPATYPLEGIKVEGVRRVAASEKKWTSWMMIIQGAITFANGSITDGLVIFRKNVAGALEGHSECAICYSIISPTKKIPNKRCMTCKNLFHSDCLFKWFSSSNQNTCPLCRNPFQYM